jgi:hypothetical protein
MVFSSSKLNETNISCPLSILWDQSDVDDQRSALYVCIIAVITHSVFWFQFLFCPSVRQKSMQWLYAYLITDILLLFRFFFTYIVHTTSTQCIPNRSWALFICYFEGSFDNYLNILEVYILLALNVCRYIQIVHNRNAYTTYVRLLVLSHLFIYLMPLVSLIIQLLIGWAQLDEYTGGSCDIAYTNVYSQIFNIIIGFVLPILLNLFVLYFNMRHIHVNSPLRGTQHHVSAREKYHRSLVTQFLVFYTVWLLLWSPNVIVYQITSGKSELTIIALLLNYIEIALDPIIIAALDVRFQKVWRKLWMHLSKIVFCIHPNQRRVAPLRTNPIVWTTRYGQHRTTAF